MKCILALVVGLFAPSILCGAQVYSIIELSPVVGGGATRVQAVNNSGQAVGYTTTPTAVWNAAYWQPSGAVTNLYTLGGMYSSAFGINDQGEITGYAFNSNNQVKVFLYSNGHMDAIGVGQGEARAINNKTEIVGSGNEIGGAFYWNGSMTAMGLPGGDSGAWANDINNNSESIGYGFGPGSSYYRGWVKTADGVTYIGPQNGYVGTYAFEINDNGDVAGASYINNFMRAFVWNKTEGLRDLGFLAGDNHSEALGINLFGEVVGDSAIGPTSNSKAVLWRAGSIYDLNSLIPSDSNWELSSANSISDTGYIVGNGFHNGQERGFLLVPIPEPSILILMSLSFLAAARRRHVRTM
jgi:probable HAF family extracellular repeat protein